MRLDTATTGIDRRRCVGDLGGQKLRGNGELDRAFEAWSKALIAHAEGVPGDAVPTTRAALTKMEKELVHVQRSGARCCGNSS